MDASAMGVTTEQLKFDGQGLITAVAQDRLTGEVRMVAWMNREAVEQTLATGKATFFSRSRGRLWVKGEESGNVLLVSDVRADCDADTLLLLCEPAGPSCHTGRENCFFQQVSAGDGDPAGKELAVQDEASIQPFLQRLEAVLEERKHESEHRVCEVLCLINQNRVVAVAADRRPLQGKFRD